MSNADHHRDDERIRQLLSQMPATINQSDIAGRVVSKIHRRRLARRCLTASTIICAVAGTFWISQDRWNRKQPQIVRHHVTSDDLANASIELEQLATAFGDLPSPVVDLQMLEGEPEAWMTYLTSLDSNAEGI